MVPELVSINTLGALVLVSSVSDEASRAMAVNVPALLALKSPLAARQIRCGSYRYVRQASSFTSYA